MDNGPNTPPEKVWSFAEEVEAGATPANVRERMRSLTWREVAILKASLLGLPNKKVAIELQVGMRTVEACRRSIREKLKVRSWAEVIVSVCKAELS